ncbi:MAG: hypothetical protein EOL95_07220 [Bacteroidia bacterium]|nr:hypothetical protein [Bacteroidia bacterium]
METQYTYNVNVKYQIPDANKIVIKTNGPTPSHSYICRAIREHYPMALSYRLVKIDVYETRNINLKL